MSANWTSLPDIPTARFDCGRVTLPNGDVLVFAGHDASNNTLTTSELLDHTTKTWSTVGPVATGRLVPGVILLNNGKVLTFGGSLHTGTDIATDTCEIYDPVAKTWSTTGSMGTGRYLMANFLLADGTVLAAGGSTSPGASITSSEIYDPNTGTWSATGDLPNAYSAMFYKTLGDGRPIVVGARVSFIASASQTATFSSGTWTQQADFPNAVQAYSNSSAVLSNGDFIVMCPCSNSGALLAVNNNYIYSQISNTWSTHNGPGTAHLSTPVRLSSTQILLPGGVLGIGPFVYTNICDIYDENADTWTATASLPVAGVCATQTEYQAPLLSATIPLWVGAFSDIAINPTPYIFVMDSLPVITSATATTGVKNTFFTYRITASNDPTSFSTSTLPAGLSLNTSTGIISGTPTGVAVTSVTLSAINAGGTGTAPLTITIQETQKMSATPKPFEVVYDANANQLQYEFPQGYVQVPSSAIPSGGVTSFNTLTGAVTISAGSNITLTPSGNNVAIAATGGSVPAHAFATGTTGITSTSTTPVAFGASASITLTNAAHVVHMSATLPYKMAVNTSDGKIGPDITLFRDGSTTGHTYSFVVTANTLGLVTVALEDSPGDTSAHTYQLRGNVTGSESGSDGSVTLGGFVAGTASVSTITLDEVL